MNSILLTGIFVLNPFISLFVSIYALLKKNKLSIILTSISLAVIFIYFPIMYDTSSNYYYTYYLSKMNYKISEMRLYNLIPVILKKININFMSIILLYTIFILYVKFNAIYIAIKRIKNKKKILYISSLFMFTIIYREIMDLNRFYLAISICIYGIFYMNKKIYKYVLFFIAFKIHSSIALIILYLLIYKKLIDIDVIVKISFFLVFVNLKKVLVFIIPILTKVDIKIANKANNYLTHNQWGYRYIFDLPKMKIINNLIVLFLILLIYLYINRLYKRKYILKFYQLLVLSSILLFNFFTLFERYSIITIFVGIILISRTKISFKKNKKLLISILIINFFNFYFVNFIYYGELFTKQYKIIIDNSKKEEILMKGLSLNLILLLDLEENGYSDKQILKISNRGKRYKKLIKQGVKIEGNY